MSGRFARDEAGIAYVTRSAFGPVGQDIRRRTVAVNIAARREAPVGAAVPGDAWSPGRQGGRLKASIYSEVAEGPDGVKGRVVADVSYAASVHDGSRPHEILPTRRRYLRWRAGSGYGDEVFARRVSHPGNRRANPFLRRALREAQR